MGLLTDKERARLLMAHGHLYEFVCDTPNCDKCIKFGELCVALKSERRTDGLHQLLGRITTKVRCMECQNRMHPPPQKEVKVKGAGRGASKVSAEIAASLKIDPIVRRTILKLLKLSPEGIVAKELMVKLRKRKVIREMKKAQITATIRDMRKLKMFKKKGPNFILPPEKKVKEKKTAKKAPKKKLAKRSK